ncbi:MAG: glycosyltransferase [Candidatus Marinimicrobia bacterium]|nr:glycosyltransferase [Candidatus Neomarinimicrobiota bacterium]
MPAPAIENVVLHGIDCFLRDRLALAKRLKLSNASPAHLNSTLKGAAQLADGIAKSGPAEQRRMLLEILENIDVGRDRVGITLRVDALRSMIGEGEPKQKRRKRAGQPEHTFTLDLPVSFRRRGVEMKLIITDDRKRLPAPDPHLIAAVARGRRWFAEIRGGQAGSISELAKRHGVDRTDIGRAILFAFPAANRNTTTIHNPVPIPTMPPGPSPVSGETFRFIAVAVYRPEKRLDLLLDAFGALTRQHDNIRLTLVGDGVQRGALKKQIGQLGLGDLVDMTGFLPADGVMEQLALGHCLVMPSDVETFGLALVEAMSMGLPVIATKCGGPEDIVRPTVGALIPVNDREALTEAMHSMMSGYDRYDRAAIRAYAVDRFGPQRYVAAYGSLFRELASSP